MHDHSRGFVDHGEIVVLKNDIKRNVLRFEPCGIALGQFDVNNIAFPHFVRRASRPAIYKHIFAVDQLLQLRARPAVDLLSKERIESLSDILVRSC